MPNKIWKPTAAECNIIKAAASRESEPHVPLSRVLLEPGIRGNTEDDSKNAAAPRDNLNIALISDDPNWDDTDLNDYGTWADFRKGVQLTANGEAIVDFYIRRRGDTHCDLYGNVTAEYANGQLSLVYGYGNNSDYYNAPEGK